MFVNKFKVFQFFLLLIFGLLLKTKVCYGGSCWLNISKNGKCSALVNTGGTKEDCCSRGMLSASVSAAWSEEDLNPSSIFYMHIQGGVPCKKCKDSCDGVRCPENQKCTIRNGQPKCICAPDCKKTDKLFSGPVCGIDGRTYRSMCRLLKRSCRRKISISVAYEGPCKSSCSKLNCPPMKQCLLDQNLTPHCVNCTQRKCSMGPKVLSGEKSVCAMDGQTYPSICHLRETACQRGKAIPISYRGPCKNHASCKTIHCSTNQKCLTEIKTGQPRCVTCNRPRWCKMQQRNTISGPICGSNNKTYKTWCDMMDDACDTGYTLDTKYFGPCFSKRP